MFALSLRFPEDYPSSPPMVRFTTPIFHPNGILFVISFIFLVSSSDSISSPTLVEPSIASIIFCNVSLSVPKSVIISLICFSVKFLSFAHKPYKPVLIFNLVCSLRCNSFKNIATNENKAPQSSTLYLSFSYGDTIEIIISGGACIKTNNNNKIVYYKK